MSQVRIYLDDSRVGPVFKRISSKVAPAVRAAAQDAADEIEIKTRADISGAGRFGSRWFPSTSVSTGGGNTRIDVSVGTPLWIVFQRGMTIKGRPLLYIPTAGLANPVFFASRDGKIPPVISVKQVYEPKKFMTLEIIREIAARMSTFIKTHWN